MGLKGPLPLLLILLTGLVALAVAQLWPMLELSLWLLGGIAAALLAAWLMAGGPAALHGLGWRRVLTGGNVVLASTLMLAVVVGLNLLASFVPLRLDLTDAGRNTLSPVSHEVLERLPGGMEATAFFPETAASRPARDAAMRLLSIYRVARPDFSWRIVDPEVNPGEAQRLGVSAYGTIVFTHGDRRVAVDTIDERAFTEALMQAGGLAAKTVCIVGDAGGPQPNDAGPAGLVRLAAGIRRDLFEIRPVGAADGTLAAGECTVVAVIGVPALADSRLAGIRPALAGGAGLLLLAEPDADASVRELALAYGLRVGKGRVVDGSTHVGEDDATPAVLAGRHPQTALTGNLATTYFPGVAPVEPAIADDGWPLGPVGTEGGILSPVAVTTAAARLDGAAGDSGPRAVGAMAVRGGQRAVVFGDSDFVTNAHIFSGGNGDLVLNAVRWLAEARPLTDIRPKPYAFRRLVLDARQRAVLVWTATAVFPGLALLVALGLWWRRR